MGRTRRENTEAEPGQFGSKLIGKFNFSKNDEALDSSSLLECWIQSRGALQQFLSYREEQIDAVIKAQQNFIQSEQALVLGHSMHPSPKSRQGFVQNDWQLYSPETQSTFKMHFLYIHPDQVVHDNAHKIDISNQLKQDLAPFLMPITKPKWMSILIMRYYHYIHGKPAT